MGQAGWVKQISVTRILCYNLDPPSVLAGVAPLAPVPLLAQAVAQALGAHLLRGPGRVALARCG